VSGYAAAAVRAVRAVWLPLVGGTLTTCAVFLPMVYLSGELRTLFFSFAALCSLTLILSLLASVTLGLLWAWLGGLLLFVPYVLATTVLFAGVPWSKFAHMFFKPAAAFEKRVSEADGTHQNLPTLTRDDPEQQARHSMELLQNAPMDMGLGIKREAPRHY